jgi:hypothetical protein
VWCLDCGKERAVDRHGLCHPCGRAAAAGM